MKFTNKYNLPPDVYKACSAEQYEPNPDRFGVTALIAPAHQRQLVIKHWDKIEVDASTRLWAVLGEGIHLVMDKHNRPEKKETIRKFETEFDGATIVGIIDNYDVNESGIIIDYKVTSVYSFIYGLKDEWEQQLNVYAWLLNKNGIEVKGLRISAILRDWDMFKSLQSNYPPIPFQTIEVPLWPLEKTENFIRNRLQSHRKCAILCTETERWQRPTVYAVMKKGRKSAVACNKYIDGDKIPFTKDDANAWIRNNQKKGEQLYIEKRPGSFVRCDKRYCMVKEFCDFGSKLK